MAPERQEQLHGARVNSSGQHHVQHRAGMPRHLHRGASEGVRVMKFGGSVLISAESILQAAKNALDAASPQHTVVVVSAMRGVTDRLYGVLRALRLRDVQSALTEGREIARLHFGVASRILGDEETNSPLRLELAALGQDLDRLISGAKEHESFAHLGDEIVSFGERLSARIFAAALEKLGARAKALDAFHFILVNSDRENPHPQLVESREKIQRALRDCFDEQSIPVVTGFVAATPEGRVATLGRNSSDLSAAVLACAVGAQDLTIWTSVDGFFDADPRRKRGAQWLEYLSYEQAAELSKKGAKVVHPKALAFLAEHNVPLLVRNAMNQETPGTWVGKLRAGAAR
jgi:aspartokinase/homoserine dehydrogenase 1